ncbi:MAG TPA: FUSC family protein [Candidatus Binataceae bacterium]|nr:FUSC family protein [Candidatus Binataceae bacterium]
MPQSRCAARIHLEVDRVMTTARENLPREIRTMVAPELQAATDAIGDALEEIAQHLAARVIAGVDELRPAARARLNDAMETLTARMIEIRPAYIGKSSSKEIENFAAFIDSLAVLARHLGRPLDEPPRPATADSAGSAMPRSIGSADPGALRYSLKVGLCIVLGYVIGLISRRPDLFIILVTVITTATPTYGATLHKMYLRIAGAVIGGAVSLLVIIIVSPNFDTLPIYLLACFAVFFPFAYSSLGNARMSFAGKQMGVIFSLVFVGLSPAVDIYEPLWRIWGVLLGDVVVATVFFTMWPEYAGDPVPRMRKVTPTRSRRRRVAQLRAAKITSIRPMRKRCTY